MIAAMPSSPEAVVRRCLDLVVPAGEPLLLALSGGSDSVALLGLLRGAGHPLVAAHVDHGLRPGSSADARAVAGLCRDLDVPCRVLHAPPTDDGRSETAARRRRLAALTRAARDQGCAWVLCAHHLDDALETLLLQLSRGHQGLRALAGVPSCRLLDADVRLLRPLLCGPGVPGRRELAQWREAAGLPARDDPSNRDTRIPRNALRVTLSADRAPLDRAGLSATRRRAVAALQALVGDCAARLADGLVARGDGIQVLPRAFPTAAAGQGAWAETLRLLGASLDRPRRVRVRAAVLARVQVALAAGRGRLELPCDDGLLDARAARDGLHLPGVTLASGDPTAAVLAGLARTSLHL